METREAELKGLGADFVFGFVQSMDGERDPRNLLLAFQIAKSIVHRGYDLGKFTEELFEVTSCYFPIDFSPPPNDPHGITREELILTLRDVLAGTPQFAEFLLPLIIEKLDSDVQSAKLDSLQTLTACVSQYEHKDLAEFLEGLWASLRREVFQTSSEKIESAGLAALTALTSCLSRSVLNSDSEDSLCIFLDLVLKDCKHHLCEPDLKLVWPSAKLLQAACSASNRASHIIVTAVVPSIIEQYNNRTQMNASVMCWFCFWFCFFSGSVGFSVEEVVLTCSSLQRIAEQVQDTEETGRCFHDIIIPRLLSLALQSVSLICFSQNIVRAFFMRFVWFPFWVFHVSRLAEKTASRAVSLFLDGDVSFLPDNSFPSDIQLLKQKGDSWSQSQMVCLLMGCVCSLPRSVEVPQMDQLLLQLEELSCTCSHPPSYTSAAKCFAGLVNKRAPGQFVCTLLLVFRVYSVLDSESSSVRTQAFTLMIWVRVMLHVVYIVFHCVSLKLFSLLDDADLGPMAADGFSLLMSDSSDVLNRSCHADVRIMYRQRFFSENSAKLVQGFNAAPQEKKPNYLKALSNIVNKLPKQVQVTELPALLSLLLEALSCPDQGVQLSTLSCLEPVLIDPPAALIQQLEALVNRLLALTSSRAMLNSFQHMSLFQVLPFRARVLRALARPLDDKKRLVRDEAVQARSEWFLLGSPGGS
uniref:MMS19 nucleotide excision repair protein n=1 Tax=Sparus aurata TaxID=8175 RepID=A0A671TVK9_SPAAU